ncbi:MAG: DUF2339 domain-containing protein [Fimbriimonadales bacterium]
MEEILRRLASLEDRMGTVERQLGLAPRPVAEVAPATPPPVPPPFLRPAPAPRPAFVSRTRTDEDTEILIGTKVLPWVGAIMVVLAVLYFVVWGFSKGFITPTMVFTGEVAFCLGFIGLGLWKRQEGFDFGHILAGIGSCGLYLTFAGGHLVYHLFNGETLVALFALLSLANIAYAGRIASTAFLWIGTVGGLIGGILPVTRDAVPVGIALHGIVVASSAFVIARQKWFGSAIGLAVAGVAALVPLMVMNDQAWSVRIATVYATGVVGLSAVGYTYRRSEGDPYQLGIPIGILGLGIIGLLIRREPFGYAHLACLAAGTSLASLLLQDADARRQTWVGGIGTFLILAPITLEPIQMPFAFAALSLILALATVVESLPADLKKIAKGAVPLMAALSLGSYLHALADHHLESLDELFVLAGVAVGTIASAWAHRDQREPAWGLATTVLGGLAIRAAVVFVNRSEPTTAMLTLTAFYSSAAYAALASLVAKRIRSDGLLIASWLIAAFAGSSYVVGWLSSSLGTPASGIAASTAALALIAILGAASHKETSSDGAIGIACGLASWAVFTNMGELVRQWIPLDMAATPMVSISWALYGFVLLGAGFVLKLRELRYLSFVALTATVAKVAIVDLASTEAGVRVAILLGLGLVLLASGYWYVRTQTGHGAKSA